MLLRHRAMLTIWAFSSVPLYASAVPLLPVTGETDPIPEGETDTDDIAIWVSKRDPKQSLILGTSKYDESPQAIAGLGVYDLQGKEKQFFAGAKLNNVDLIYGVPVGLGRADLAVASNRSNNALDVYRIDPDSEVSFAGRIALFDANGQSFEPYGLCLGTPDRKGRFAVYLPTKSGVLYHYRIQASQLTQAELVQTYDLSRHVTPVQDLGVQDRIRKELIAEGEEEELEEELAERFALEGCVFDGVRQRLYVGMENLGIFELDARSDEDPRLLLGIEGSWTDIENWADDETPRITDDIEGMDILRVGNRSFLLFSSQGINELSVFDLDEDEWVGNFRLALGSEDPVTGTDGLALVQASLGKPYREGLIVVHDDLNTDGSGQTLKANYKLAPLGPVLDALDLSDDD